MKLGRKITGAKYHASRKKKRYELPGIPRIVKLSKRKTKNLRATGGKTKIVLLTEDYANVTDLKGKTKKSKILNVIETKANRFLARQNILIKGAIIETEAGKACITNRPGQEGSINAIIVKE
jgi:small subunit ribosomal protein S8e